MKVRTVVVRCVIEATADPDDLLEPWADDMPEFLVSYEIDRVSRPRPPTEEECESMCWEEGAAAERVSKARPKQAGKRKQRRTKKSGAG